MSLSVILTRGASFLMAPASAQKPLKSAKTVTRRNARNAFESFLKSIVTLSKFIVFDYIEII